MLTDAAGLIIALTAAHLSTLPATDRSTWGMRRAEVIGAALQAGMLAVVGLFVAFKAVHNLLVAPQVEASGTRSFSPGAGNKVTWCVRARNDAGQTSDWECSSATAGPRVAVGTEKSFPIITDIDEAPEARCTPQDVDDTGWPPSVCRRLVIDASGFNPDSTVQCGYRYSEPGGGSWHEESFTVDSDGAARHRFPHRVDVGRVPPSYSITCTQQ